MSVSPLRARRGRVWPWLALVGLMAAGIIMAATASATPVPGLVSHPDCTLRVPAAPTTAKGLATPYQLRSAGQQCSESNQGVAAFVQAVILDPATGSLFVYDPVVRDAGKPLQGTAPPVPTLPSGAVVVIWTGFNGNTLRLVGPGARGFVNFAQQSYLGSPRFFAALRHAEAGGKVTVPPLGTASDGMPCPSTRDFSVVDQDQSDNVTTTYPAYGVANGSDDALLGAIDAALGCHPWAVPSLSAPGTMASPGLLEEEQAAVGQAAPAALVPGLDPFVTRHGQPFAPYLNLYRAQVGQPPTSNPDDTPAYCANLAATGEPRLKGDAGTEAGAPPPVFAPIGLNLALVLAARFEATWVNLHCPGPSPVTVATNDAGVAISATYK